MRRRAAALVERLCLLDSANAELEDELASLRAQHAAPATPPPAQPRAAERADSFAPPPTRHAWPLAEGTRQDALADYDRRVDDAVLLEARRGAALLRRFALLGRTPRVRDAARALVAAGRSLPRAAEGVAPEVSIIIPMHGGLPWTLNCLDALLSHPTARTCEVIVADDGSPDDVAGLLGEVAASLDVRLAPLGPRAGFGPACNAAAAQARGRFLVLLNNDTRVVPGWLDALLDSFTLFPDAGLVGAKLFYPDGRLQEAGGIVWRDGSAWNYGRNDDPNWPRYTHARRVDYVSAASVAVPTALWRELGGFDQRYAPAYAEDADLALRLRAAGHGVWLQPDARVIHYEGKTAGTDPGRGVKAHQAVNQAKLFLRWRETLETHGRNGEQPYLERERDVRRRALVIDATTPTPTRDAGSVTATQTMRLLQGLGYKVHFAPQDNLLFQPAHTPALLREGIECAYAPYEPDVDTLLARIGRLFDVALVYRAPVLEAVLPAVRRHAPQAALLFHPMDLHHLRLAREAALREEPALHAAAAAMRARELRLVAAADCTITHSTHERALLEAALPGAPVIVWPFMFEWQGTARPFAERDGFVFLGGYRHPPNVDAAVFFAREVLPRIQARLPAARFVVAGADAGAEVLALTGPSVTVTGHVADLRDVLDRARAFVCPVRFGAGVKGKISTAMAYGLPVVSTPCGAEGMALAEGADLLVAEGAAALAEACVRLHEDAVLWEALSRRGQEIVRARHSLATGRDTLQAAIETAHAHRVGVTPS